MPSWMKFAGLWGLAAIAALTMSWVAVSQVRNRVIQPVTVIPTTMVALGSESTDPTVVVVEPTVGDRPDPEPTTSTTSGSVDSTSGQAATSTTRPRSSGSATTSTATTSRTTSTTALPATTTTTAQQPQPTTTTAPSADTSSHSTPGGSVTISASPGVVGFVSAIPQAGFTTELRDTGPERVRVRFVSATTIFEFEAKWDNGQLDIETSEHTP